MTESESHHAPKTAKAKSRYRDDAGVIVTVEETTTRELRTYHSPGLAQDALRHVCVKVDALEGDWKVAAISTPRTIVGDLLQSGTVDKLGRTKMSTEQILLGKIGRMDLYRLPDVKSERGQMSNRRRKGATAKA